MLKIRYIYIHKDNRHIHQYNFIYICTHRYWVEALLRSPSKCFVLGPSSPSAVGRSSSSLRCRELKSAGALQGAEESMCSGKHFNIEFEINHEWPYQCCIHFLIVLHTCDLPVFWGQMPFVACSQGALSMAKAPSCRVGYLGWASVWIHRGSELFSECRDLIMASIGLFAFDVATGLGVWFPWFKHIQISHDFSKGTWTFLCQGHLAATFHCKWSQCLRARSFCRHLRRKCYWL